MSLLLLFAGTRAAAVVTPPPVDQGGPTARSVHQLNQWQQKWEDDDFSAVLAALLLL